MYCHISIAGEYRYHPCLWHTLLFGGRLVNRVCRKPASFQTRVWEYTLLRYQTKLVISWGGGHWTKSWDHDTPWLIRLTLCAACAFLTEDTATSFMDTAMKLRVADVWYTGMQDSSCENWECCTSNCSSNGSSITRVSHRSCDEDMCGLVEWWTLQPHMHPQQD